MNAVLDEILKTGQVATADGRKVALDSNVTREEGAFLQGVLEKTPGTDSLEIGLAYGVSTLFFCDVLAKRPGARHVVVDPMQNSDEWKGIGLKNLERAGFKDLIEFHEAPAHLALPELEKQGRRFDFAFIDGWHTFDYALVDFFLVDKLLKVGGVVAFDDVDFESVRKVCRFVATNLAYEAIGSWTPPRYKPSAARRLFRAFSGLPAAAGRVLRPELVAPHHVLGLPDGIRAVAFRKKAPDSRPSHHYAAF